MCDPISAIGLGLSAAGQVAGFMGQKQATDDYNAAARQNRTNSILAANDGYATEGQKLIYDEKKNQQEAYDAIMKARQTKGAVEASAGSAGFDGSSITVTDLVSEASRAEARDQQNFQIKREDLENAYDSRTKSINAQAAGRINSMPLKSGPSALALGLGIASSGLNAAKGSPQGKTWLGIE